MEKKLSLLRIPALNTLNEITNTLPFKIKHTNAELEDLVFIIKNNKLEILLEGKSVTNFDFVWLSSNWDVRDIAYALKQFLDSKNIPSTIAEKTISKLTDHVVFSLNNLNTPNTIFLNIAEAHKHLKIIKKICRYPIIIKDIKGHGGTFSKLVKNEKELLQYAEKLPKNRRYMLQEFIPNEFDWGIIVTHNKVTSAEKSYPRKGEFRNNARRGAKEVFVPVNDVPEKVKKLALAACKTLGPKWLRADIIFNNNTKEPYLLEVNRVPGVTSNSSEVDAGQAFLSTELSKHF